MTARIYKTKSTPLKPCVCCGKDIYDISPTKIYCKSCGRYISKVRAKLGCKYRNEINKYKDKINYLENEILKIYEE